jgi:hypothetical protein
MTATPAASATLHPPHCVWNCIGLGPFVSGRNRFDLSIHKANYRGGEPSRDDRIVLVYGPDRYRRADVVVWSVLTQAQYDSMWEAMHEAFRRASLKGLLHPDFLARGIVL